MDFPHDSAGKESTHNAGDLGSIPGLGRSSGEGKGYPLQYSGLENSMNCIVRGVAKSRIRLSDFHNNVVCTIVSSLHRGTKGMLHTVYSSGFTNWGTLNGISYKQQIIVNFPLNYFSHSQREIISHSHRFFHPRSRSSSFDPFFTLYSKSNNLFKSMLCTQQTFKKPHPNNSYSPRIFCNYQECTSLKLEFCNTWRFQFVFVAMPAFSFLKL